MLFTRPRTTPLYFSETVSLMVVCDLEDQLHELQDTSPPSAHRHVTGRESQSDNRPWRTSHGNNLGVEIVEQHHRSARYVKKTSRASLVGNPIVRDVPRACISSTFPLFVTIFVVLISQSPTPQPHSLLSSTPPPSSLTVLTPLHRETLQSQTLSPHVNSEMFWKTVNKYRRGTECNSCGWFVGAPAR